MSCFWDGLLQKLTLEDFAPFYLEKKPSKEGLLTLLQNNLVTTACVQWQGEHLSPLEMEENFQAVEAYDPKDLNSGYYCSTADPFLFLVAEIFKVSILHKYHGVEIRYTNIHNPERVLHFGSNRGHFWAEKEKSNDKNKDKEKDKEKD